MTPLEKSLREIDNELTRVRAMHIRIVDEIAELEHRRQIVVELIERTENAD